jgi:DNA-binding protein HU-beta
MSRQAVVDAVATSLGLTKDKAKDAVNAVAEALNTIVSGGDEVLLPGFGKFKLKKTEERQGRNPGTGAAITIPAGERITFKQSKKG